MKKRFGVLRTLSTVLKILGVVAAVCAVLGSLIALVVSFSGGDMFEAMGLDETSGVFVGLFGAIMVWYSDCCMPCCFTATANSDADDLDRRQHPAHGYAFGRRDQGRRKQVNHLIDQKSRV
jgi:hypothetical protein